MDEFVLVEFDIERTWMEGREERAGQQQGGHQAQHSNAVDHLPPSDDVPTSSPNQCHSDDLSVGMLD